MENETKSSWFTVVINVASVVCFAIVGVGGAYAFDVYANTYQISKVKFICTKIEQVGKNMDDVVCVQYTEQKYSRAAIEQSKVAYLSR